MGFGKDHNEFWSRSIRERHEWWNGWTGVRDEDDKREFAGDE